jgi:hypothetical protein
MSLVGDLLQGVRELAPDPCQTLFPPSFSPTVTPAVGGLFLAGATAYLKATQGTPWGESAASIEQTGTNAGAFNISCVVTCSYLATYVRVYFSTAGPGAEDQYVEVDITTPSNLVVVTLAPLSTISQNFPPVISRAFVPDTDGNVLSAALIYRWLNEGLNFIGQLTDGIRDCTGVPSLVGQAQYQLIGNWLKMDSNFFDGYPYPGGSKEQVFRHSPVTGLSGVGVCNQSSDRQIIELWPQPNRTAGQGALTTAMLATDTSLACTFGSNQFVLGFGLALIGNFPPTQPPALVGPKSCELVYYSTLGGSGLSMLTRGMGGTQPQAWPIGTNVQEVNCYFTGKRMPQLYQRGQANFVLTVPNSFENCLRSYLTARYKLAEQDVDGHDKLMNEVRKMAGEIKSLAQPLGPRQIAVRIGGVGGTEIISNAGSIFGGVIQT